MPNRVCPVGNPSQGWSRRTEEGFLGSLGQGSNAHEAGPAQGD